VALFLFGASGAVPVFQYGRVWTVLSAAWLHAGILHILFNMMAVRQLAPMTTELYGPGRMVIIYTAGAVVGFH
jgi:rhomboid protease GluP